MSRIRDALIAASQPLPKMISVDGVSSPLFVRILTVGEIVAQDTDTKDNENRPAVARALCRVLCDEEGVPVFDARKTDDIAAVLAMPWHIVRSIMTFANTINGLIIATPGAPPTTGETATPK